MLAAERVNAVIERDLESPALWMPSSVMAQADGHVSVFPHIMLDRAKPGLLAVNKSGRRFVNEADPTTTSSQRCCARTLPIDNTGLPDLRSRLHPGLWHRAGSSRDQGFEHFLKADI